MPRFSNASSSRRRLPWGRGAAIAGLAFLAGCAWLAPAPQPRGNRVNADELKQLVPGRTTQSDASALLGSPTAKGTFDQNTWFYISEMTRPQIGGTQVILDQHVVQLQFDNQGVLRNVEALGKNQGLPVPIIARTTPSPGTEASFFQQLFGNVGRFNPGLGSNQTGPSVGAPQAR